MGGLLHPGEIERQLERMQARIGVKPPATTRTAGALRSASTSSHFDA